MLYFCFCEVAQTPGQWSIQIVSYYRLIQAESPLFLFAQGQKETNQDIRRKAKKVDDKKKCYMIRLKKKKKQR